MSETLVAPARPAFANFVGGEWLPSESGNTYEKRNPWRPSETVGEFPGLAQLDEDDNLRSTSDFRGVYAALMEQWMDVDAGPIVPGASSTTGVFARPNLVT